ncbi:hypothetical protein V500_04589 [Pseudogymnoascus sp. VKM F-4518 (FW-2643)]|nr:hypothetical protein V500_04589 [Pseudogymnoascus sp. VKM F-4518 (FW-2643)]
MRKRLQRKIAETRQISHSHQALASPKRSSSVLDGKLPEKGKGVIAPRSDGEDGSSSTQLSGKRKYVKHPKLDHNAPATPRSSYVIFANKMREDPNVRSLSFTEIAKLVGKNWQNLTTSEKEPYEQQAFDAKGKYTIGLAEYRQTESYEAYSEYLQGFNAKLQESSREEANEISPSHSSLSEQCDGRSLVCGTAIREYGVSFLATKAAMKSRIEELETRLKHSECVLYSLSGKRYPAAAVLKQLNKGDGIEQIYRNIVEKQASDSELMPHSQEAWELSSQPSGTGSEPTNKRTHSSSIQDSVDHYSTSGWTTVTTDFELVKKLHLLYFSWDHPFCSVLSKYHFIKDRDTGRQRYCSPLLVNIMAALGCRFSDRVKINTNFDRGEKFYLEAERIWGAEQGDTSIATIQATALMSLWEASQGRDSKAYYYSRQAMSMAVEIGLHNRLVDNESLEISDEVRSATFWGIFVLDQIWSLYSGQVPNLSCRGTFTIPPLVLDGQDLMDWAPYFDDETQSNERATQTSNVRSVFRGICELSNIIYQSLHLVHSRQGSLTSRDVIDVYGKYLNWYESMLGVLKSGVNSTPTAIFAHLLYHFGIIILFGPLIGVRLMDSSVIPNDICSQAADAINSHIWSYRELYSLRRIHAFIPYISLTASVAHLVIARTQGSMTSDTFSNLTRGISYLHEMTPSNAFAGRAADALQSIASRSVTGADTLSSGGENWSYPAESATSTYSFRHTHSILSHHLSTRGVSTFSFYISHIVATATYGERC